MENRPAMTPVFDIRLMPEEVKESSVEFCKPAIMNALQLGEYICKNRNTMPQDIIKLTEDKGNLEELDLKHLRFGDKAIEHLGVVLYFVRNVKSADFSDMLLDERKVRIIAQPLCHFKELIEVKFTGNEIRDGCQYLADCFRGMVNLEVLDLNDCEISAENFKSLCPGLKMLKSLQVLQISFNPISDIGCKALCEILPEIPSLCCIELFTCSITNKGGQHLQRAFEKQRFESILLGNNKFTPSFENKLKQKFDFVHVGVRHNTCNIF